MERAKAYSLSKIVKEENQLYYWPIKLINVKRRLELYNVDAKVIKLGLFGKVVYDNSEFEKLYSAGIKPLISVPKIKLNLIQQR